MRSLLVGATAIALLSAALYPWIGWYAAALGVGILGAWFALVLWRDVGLDLGVLALLAGQVLVIWVAFGFAYLEMTPDLSTAMSVSMQNLMHYDFVSVPTALSEAPLYRVVGAGEGLVGYMLIVSGVAMLVRDRGGRSNGSSRRGRGGGLDAEESVRLRG